MSDADEPDHGADDLLRRALIDAESSAAVALSVGGLPVSEEVTVIFHGRRDLGTIQTYVAPGRHGAGGGGGAVRAPGARAPRGAGGAPRGAGGVPGAAHGHRRERRRRRAVGRARRRAAGAPRAAGGAGRAGTPAGRGARVRAPH